MVILQLLYSIQSIISELPGLELIAVHNDNKKRYIKNTD